MKAHTRNNIYNKTKERRKRKYIKCYNKRDDKIYTIKQKKELGEA